MTERDSSRAVELIDCGEFGPAGDRYTQAAYRALSYDAITSGSDHEVGKGLGYLLRAGMSYRGAEHLDRARNRSEQGILIANDLQEYVIDEERRRAVLQEYIAYFHAIGKIDGAGGEYQKALEMLEAADLEYTISFHSCPIAVHVTDFTKYVIQWAEKPPSEGLELYYDFSGRVSYKSEAR